MGGDGGTISSNRAYLRGAGKADHTADQKRFNASRTKEEEAELARTILTSCAISGEAFNLTPNEHGVSKADILACPYGRLYKRENALEALLTRSSGGGSREKLERIVHIRGRKDLHPVRFNIQKKENGNYAATCPITGSEIGGGSVPCVLVVRSSASTEGNDMPNVMSERAVEEMGAEKLQDEYGPFEKKDLIRLAPPYSSLEEIKKKWQEQMEAERLEKLNKKKEKKRKRADDPSKEATSKEQTAPSNKSNNLHHVQKQKQIQQSKTASSIPTAAQEARSVVQSAVESNPVLSNLFGTKKKSSEKERRDALFTRNC